MPLPSEAPSGTNADALRSPARHAQDRGRTGRFPLMFRLSLLITMVVLLAVPTVSVASEQQIFDDCQDNGRLDKRYSDSDYRKALKDMPEDLDEYTNCSDLVRAGLAGVDTSGSNGGGTGGGAAGGTGGG